MKNMKCFNVYPSKTWHMYVRIHSTIFSLLVWTNCQTKSCNFFHTFLSTFLGLVFQKQNLKKGCRNSLGDDGINSSLQSNFVWGAIIFNTCDTDIISLSLLYIDAKSILFPKFHVRMNTKHLNAFSLFVQYNNTVIYMYMYVETYTGWLFNVWQGEYTQVCQHWIYTFPYMEELFIIN